MKRKLTLGLVVFVVGVFITSCGSKKSSNNTTTNTTQPTQVQNIPTTLDLDPNQQSCSSCQRTYNGTYNVVNRDLYLQAYNYVNTNSYDPYNQNGYNNYQNFNLFQGGTAFDGLLNGLANAVLNPTLGAVQCGATVWLTSEILDAFGQQNQDISCSTGSINYFGSGSQQTNYPQYNVASSYQAGLTFYIENNVATYVDVRINSNINGRNGDSARLFRRQANVYSSQDNRIQMINQQGRLLFSMGGQVFGEMR